MPHAGHFTIADLPTMPDDGQRYDVIDGELYVTPAPGPRHQIVLTPLIASLLAYLTAHGVQRQLLTGPVDLTLRDDTLVEPDLLVADTTDVARSLDWNDLKTVYLIVEVISPSTAHTDGTRKRDAYMRYGIPEYWIVDAEQRQVEVWTPGASLASIHHETLEWRHPALSSSVAIDVVELFRLD